jgi:hypothetical protein
VGHPADGGSLISNEESSMSRPIAALLALVLSQTPVAYAQESSPAARAALAHQMYDTSLARMTAGAGTSDQVYDWSVRWLRAELEGHVANAAQAHFDRMTALQASVRRQVASGAAPTSSETACQFYLAEARAWLVHPPTVP